jgi:hypothetical protein
VKRLLLLTLAAAVLLSLSGVAIAAGRLVAGAPSHHGCRTGSCPAHHTGRTGPATASITAHGVRLRLTMPRHAYPHDALVPATIRLTNLTRRAVTSFSCLSDSYGAQVINPAQNSGSEGFGLYPELLPAPGAPWFGCAGGPFVPAKDRLHIGPRQTQTRVMDIVLRSDWVQGWAALRFGMSQLPPAEIVTPVIHLGAARAPAPRLRFLTRRGIHVRVVPASRGPVLFSEFARCKGGKKWNVSATYSRWYRARGRVLRPFSPATCKTVTEWYLFVGQEGRPIAQLYYCTLGDQCTYGYLAVRYFCKGGRTCVWRPSTK